MHVQATDSESELQHERASEVGLLRQPVVVRDTAINGTS